MSGTRRWPRTRKSTTGSTFSQRALRCAWALQASASPWVPAQRGHTPLLLLCALQGFFGKSSYSLLDKIDLSWSAWSGADQVENHKPWQIDYLSNHLWGALGSPPLHLAQMPSFSRGCVVCITPVDSWLSSSTCDAYCKVNFMRNWLDAQHEAAKYWNNKPVLLAEYKCAHKPFSHCTHRVLCQCVVV